MKVKVKLFAALREHLGQREMEWELPEGARLADLVAQLAKSYPIIRKNVAGLHFAVNRYYAGGSQVLRDGDEVAVLPPVGGG
jgi:molybdopterin converting factor subunit 1